MTLGTKEARLSVHTNQCFSYAARAHNNFIARSAIFKFFHVLFSYAKRPYKKYKN